MKKLLEFFFGKKKEWKDKIKGHQHCDFNQKEFNHSKRDPNYVKQRNEEIKKANPGKGHGGTTTDPQPPTPPPPSTGGNNVVLLVFDGITISGTSWNYSGSLVLAPSGFDLIEQQTVLDYIKRAYAGMNVTITTDPLIYNAAPTTKRSRAVFTETWEWYGQAGGVAFVNSHGTNDGVCFIFSSLLGYNTKYCGDAGQHEPGHMMGCYHQAEYDANCTKTLEYKSGVIMGIGYYVPTPQFIVGPNSLGCHTIQDDIAVIKAKLG